MVSDETYADVTLSLENEKLTKDGKSKDKTAHHFRAHQGVLAIRCPILLQMVPTPAKKKAAKEMVVDLDPGETNH